MSSLRALWANLLFSLYIKLSPPKRNNLRDLFTVIFELYYTAGSGFRVALISISSPVVLSLSNIVVFRGMFLKHKRVVMEAIFNSY